MSHFYFVFSLDMYNLLEEKPFKSHCEFEQATAGISSRLPYWALLRLAIRSVVSNIFMLVCCCVFLLIFWFVVFVFQIYDKSMTKQQAEVLLTEKGPGWLSSGEVGGFKFRPPTSDELLLALPAELLMATKKGQFKWIMKNCGFKISGLVEIFYTKLCSNESRRHLYKLDELALLKSLVERVGGAELCYAMFFGRLTLVSEWVGKAVTFATLYQGPIQSTAGVFSFSSSDVKLLELVLYSLKKFAKFEAK